jgi:hypothetical protein
MILCKIKFIQCTLVLDYDDNIRLSEKNFVWCFDNDLFRRSNDRETKKYIPNSEIIKRNLPWY